MAEPFVLAPLEPTPSRSRQSTALGVLIAVVFAVGIAAAVLKPDDNKDSKSLVLAASRRTATETTSHFTATIDISVNGANTPALLTMTGASDTATQSSSVTVAAGSMTSEVRTIAGVSYMHFEGAPLPDGKNWVQFSRSELGAAANNAPTTSDFLQQLDLLDGLVGEPEQIGKEELDGVRVTHYRLTLDFTGILDQMRQGSEALNANNMMKALDAVRDYIDITHIPGEVWLDNEGRAREFKFSLHLSANGQTIDEVANMHIGQFGEPVAIEVPPADEVVPLSEVPDFFDSLLPH